MPETLEWSTSNTDILAILSKPYYNYSIHYWHFLLTKTVNQQNAKPWGIQSRLCKFTSQAIYLIFSVARILSNVMNVVALPYSMTDLQILWWDTKRKSRVFQNLEFDHSHSEPACTSVLISEPSVFFLTTFWFSDWQLGMVWISCSLDYMIHEVVYPFDYKQN
jgi:hypothetical protein